jgi:small multidrug resistance family-3 protein
VHDREAGATSAWPRLQLGCLLRHQGARHRKGTIYGDAVTVARSIVLFVLAAIAEIGGAWLVWQGVRESRGWIWIGAGVIALGVYGFVATLQPDASFGRILAAYGGVFVAASLLWGIALDGFRPDRWDIAGALICLVGVAVIMYAPRPA